MNRIVVTLLVLSAVLSACGEAGSPDTTSSVRPPTGSLVLGPDGIGPYRIGQPVAVVMDGLASEIGGWDADSADAESTLLVPPCDPAGTRLVSWGGLVLLFAGPPGAEVFTTWQYGYDPVTANAGDARSLGLRTSDGVGLDTTREDLLLALGPRVAIEDDETIAVASFTIDGDEGTHIAGRFTDLAPDAVVSSLERRPGCEDD